MVTMADLKNQETKTRPIPVADARSVSLSILAFAALVLALHHTQEILIPIVLSFLISYALDPIVTAGQQWRIPRSLTAAILLLVIVGGFGGIVYGYRQDAAAALERIPAAAKKFRQLLQEDHDAPGAIEKVQKAASELEKTAAEATRSQSPPARDITQVQIQEQPLDLRTYLWWGSMSAFTVAGQAVMMLFLVYFILVSGDLYKRKLVKIVGPLRSQKQATVEILDDINLQIRRFLLVQLFSGGFVGVASWAAFRWIGLEQAGVWGIAAGLLNFIPYFGPVLVAGGVAVIGFLQFGALSDVALLIGVSLAITSLEGYLLIPWLIGRTAQMNAVAVFVGLLFWGWVWGAWGLLLAVPMMMIVKVVSDHIEELHPIGELLGE
jgi:predicted PurR-regulated permease PerM